MKQFAYLIFSAILLLALSACGTKEDLAPPISKSEDKTSAGDTEKQKSDEKKEGETTMTNAQLSPEVAENERLVEMVTSMGSVKIKLFPEQAPKTVENFITHSENGYYEGIIFHRIIKDFMIQGGDPGGNGMGGESIYGGSFEDEFSPELHNLRGALSMANSGPNTNGSQFFIVQSKDGTPWLDGKHTVFGQVVEGMDIIDNMANVKVGMQDKPVEDIVIEKINIIK